MAKQSGLGNNFYVGGYDLSGDTASLNVAASPRNTFDVTGLNQSASDRLLGLSSGIISFESFFNDASEQQHAALSGLITTDRVAIYTTSTTAGDPAAGLIGKQVNYDWSRGSDGGLTLSCEVQGSAGSPIEWGTILTTGTQSLSSAGSTDSVDQSASTSNGARGYLQNFTLSSGTPTVKIEHSANDSSWSDLITFTSQAAHSGDRGTSTGTVNRYVRVTVSGTFSNLKLAVVLVRGTAEDDEDLSS
jgi:hypothetical protein